MNVLSASDGGSPGIPVAAATSRFFTLNTWSRMTVNLPFSKLVFVAGEPLFVPANSDEQMLELARRKVAHSLDKVVARTYALAGAKAPRAVPAETHQAEAQRDDRANACEGRKPHVWLSLR